MAFVVAGAAGAGDVVVLQEVESDRPPRRLVSGFDEIDHLTWSPDGRALAFAARRLGNWDVFRIARDGTDLQRLTEHEAFDGWPAWSPDGQEIAFSSYRDGVLDLYRMASRDDGPRTASRVTSSDGPAIEPAWSPDGEWIAFAAWHDGAYRLEVVPTTGEARHPVIRSDRGADVRAPAWSADGRRLLTLERRHGRGRLLSHVWRPEELGVDTAQHLTTTSTIAVGIDEFVRLTTGQGEIVATVSDERSARPVDVRDAQAEHFGRQRIAQLPTRARSASWTSGPIPPGLAEAAVAIPSEAPRGVAPAESEVIGERPGFVVLRGVQVPGARIHAGLAEDFADMREEVRSAVGTDFLGTLADLWRPLGYSGSSFFSWHKTGRAFDTQMELWGPGGRRDMVLVREDRQGRPVWRMFLRAGAQDGSVGRPLVEPGWSFAAGSGDPELTAEGGRRGRFVPGGYWFDFTDTAERYGWSRIPSIARGSLNWRRDWEAIDYWHYERRDGLRWFDAVRQVYADDELDAELRADRLRDRGVSVGRLTWLGFPSGWLRGG